MIPTSFIMKVTGMCNLGCNYCFAREHFTGTKMPVEMIRVIFEQIDSLGQAQVTVSWHGGEPLLFGKEGFKRAIKYQEGLKTKFQNVIQTNGILVDEEWVEFFKENNCSVGLSIDGYRSVHNYNRPLPNGKESFELVMNGLQKLIDADCCGGIISVVSKETDVKEYFEFVKSLGIKSFHTKPCSSKWQGSITLADYARFLKELFDLWIENDDPDLSFREFTGFAENLLGGQAKLCQQSGRCSHFVSINTNGDIYPCDEQMSPEKKMGNILTGGLLEFVDSSRWGNFCSGLRDTYSECEKKCPDYDACRGGCSSERLFHGDVEYCTQRRAIVDSVRQWVLVNAEGAV